MKKILTSILLAVLPVVLTMASSTDGSVSTRNVTLQNDGRTFAVSMDMVLDDLRLSPNGQILVTPYLEGSNGETVMLPTVLVNGRNMQYVYERSGLSRKVRENYTNIYNVTARRNRSSQSISYSTSVPSQPWMRKGSATLRLATDTCGCGAVRGKGTTPGLATWQEPDLLPLLRLAYIVPPVTELPLTVHEGRARVQFEVDRTELHPEPYVCKSGQRIDNRQQLRVIEDSIRYALSNENVEIARVDVCGYASPESPYTHNDYLATNRSRALSEYIGQRFSLPRECCTYSAVPENWGEFREKVTSATDITERQRQDLLELIDAPTYGPSDFDAKERTLKSDPRFARLYSGKILPVWFPELRCTKFAISTRLRPLSDEKLAEIIKVHPEMMSLNQMFRVARLYREGSTEFNEVIAVTLRYYSDDETANLNAAVAALSSGQFDRAARLLEKAGSSPEAENARGYLSVHGDDTESALRHFRNAGSLGEARYNLSVIGE